MKVESEEIKVDLLPSFYFAGKLICISHRYHKEELVSRLVRKITHADWLLNAPRFYDAGPVQYGFYFGPVRFGGKIFELIVMKFEKD